jgi:excisionase family DNA binding protein
MEEHDMDDGMTASERLVWSVEEAGRLLGISRAYAYELVARGELPHVRLGRRVVVPKHAIQALLATDDAGDSLHS